MNKQIILCNIILIFLCATTQAMRRFYPENYPAQKRKREEAGIDFLREKKRQKENELEEERKDFLKKLDDAEKAIHLEQKKDLLKLLCFSGGANHINNKIKEMSDSLNQEYEKLPGPMIVNALIPHLDNALAEAEKYKKIKKEDPNSSYGLSDMKMPFIYCPYTQMYMHAHNYLFEKEYGNVNDFQKKMDQYGIYARDILPKL